MNTNQTRSKDLLRLVLACRRKVLKVKQDAQKAGTELRDRDEIRKTAARASRQLGLSNFDLVWENFIERNAMNDAASKRSGVDLLTGAFILDEQFTVAHQQQTLFLERGQLTLEDGDQITKQKQANIDRAVRAMKEWLWEWGIIRPILVANPGWRYLDAYRYIVENGGPPNPPNFGSDE